TAIAAPPPAADRSSGSRGAQRRARASPSPRAAPPSRRAGGVGRIRQTHVMDSRSGASLLWVIRMMPKAVADAGRTPAVRVIHAAKAMLPKLRIILVAMIATCAVALALSAGMLGTRDPANNLSGVPEVSRALMRQAVVEEPESQVLAYSRR